MIELILANGYRNKTVADILEEQKKLEETLKYMKENGLTLHGYKLDSGRLRNVIANELKAHVKPELTGELYVGIKYSKDGNVAMAIASKTEEGKIFVECIDCREVRAGDTWMLAYLKGWKARKVVIDGASGQQLLEEEMREYGIKNAHLPTVKEIIAANAKFEQGLYQRSIVHSGQPSLVQAVSNCEKRAIGSNGGFGYKAIKEEIEIALLDSVILAYWACSETKVKRRKQRISC